MGAAQLLVVRMNSVLFIPQTMRVLAALRVPSEIPRASFKPFQQTASPSTSKEPRCSFSKKILATKFCRCTLLMDWLKQPNFFAEDFKMMDKHFKSNKDLFVAGRWAIVLNVVCQRYFAGPMLAFAAFPRKSLKQPEEQPEEKEPEESPTGKRTKSQQLGAASGGSGLALTEEEEVAVPKKKKRKAKVVKEFVVTWDTKLETSHMSESHVTQAFGLMQTRSITTPEGIVVSAKNCIQPALGRLARDIDKEHVAELMRLYKKEQKQGELWLERKQIRLICFFVMTCNCS